jgi:hypothetical protein
MNERIRELLAMCQKESIDGPEYPRWTDQEKFAKLIIEECAKVCDTHMWGLYGHGSSIHADADRRWEVIRQHFGVTK